MNVRHYISHLGTVTALLVALCFSVPGKAEVPAQNVDHASKAATRLIYLRKLLDSHSGQRLLEYEGGATYFAVQTLLQQAQEALDKGNGELANTLAKEGFKSITMAIKELPSDTDNSAQLKTQYTNLHASISKRFRQFERNPQPDYDSDLLKNLMHRAEKDALKGEYETAMVKLREVNAKLPTLAPPVKPQPSKPRVAAPTPAEKIPEPDLSTPKKQYLYEVSRFQSYDELVPFAIKAKQLPDRQQKELVRAQTRARRIADQARGRAIDEEYSTAFRLMSKATTEIQKALKSVGVNM